MKRKILAVIAVLSFVSGVASLYLLKYRNTRNELIAIKAVNNELRHQINAQKIITDSLWQDYQELAGLPRYSIQQYLDNIKVKRNSSLEFVPKALLNAPIDTLKYRKYWWQFWREKPPNKRKE